MNGSGAGQLVLPSAMAVLTHHVVMASPAATVSVSVPVFWTHAPVAGSPNLAASVPLMASDPSPVCEPVSPEITTVLVAARGFDGRMVKAMVLVAPTAVELSVMALAVQDATARQGAGYAKRDWALSVLLV